MNTIFKKYSPYLIILFGFFVFFVFLFIGQATVAGGCFLIGIVMIIERIWPEKWDADNIKQDQC